jgi:hypothetical protein
MAPTAKVLAAVCLISLPAGQAVEAEQGMCVNFEPPLVLGTQYGAPAASPMGSVVFTTGRIPVAIDYFVWASGGTTYNYAQIDPPQPSLMGSGQSIQTNNINLLFDFSQTGFLPRRATFAFLDLGGNENLSVNGAPIFNGDLPMAPPAIGGANVAVTATTIGTSGSAGTVQLEGMIFSLRIGGQEFWLDDVCVYEK